MANEFLRKLLYETTKYDKSHHLDVVVSTKGYSSTWLYFLLHIAFQYKTIFVMKF